MGAFDDLIPPKSKPAEGGINPRLFNAFQETLATPAPAAAGAFDDLVPSAPARGSIATGTTIPVRPEDREVGRIYTDRAGQPRRWMGDHWGIDDAARDSTVGEFTKGLGVDFLQGLQRVPVSLADSIGWVFGGGESLITPEGRAEVQQATDYLENLKPASYRAEQAVPIVKRGEDGRVSGLGLPTSESVAGAISQSAPQIPTFLAAGGGLREAAARFLPNSPRLAAALGYGSANAALATPGGAEDVRLQALAEGATREQADAAANKAAALLAPLTTITGGVGGGLSAGQGQASSSLIRALAGGFLADAPFEGLEEGGQSAITDVALGKDVDWATALERTLQGAAAGGLPGAAIAVAERGAAPAKPARSALDDNAFADLIPAEPPIARRPDAPVAPAPEPVPASAEAAPAAPDVVAAPAPEPEAVPKVPAVEVQPEPETQPAFHGSRRNDIERIQLDRSGTGSGEANYGFGAYFAGNREGADAVRAGTSGISRVPGGGEAEAILSKFGGDRVRAAADLRRQRERAPDARRAEIDTVLNVLRAAPNRGTTYATEIPADSRLLSWDDAVADQPPAVQAALESLGVADAPTGGQAYRALTEQLGGQRQASDALAAAGVPGSRYRDGRGGQHYVVWDEGRIAPLRDADAVVQSDRAPPPAATPQAEPAPAFPPVTTPAAVRAEPASPAPSPEGVIQSDAAPAAPAVPPPPAAAGGGAPAPTSTKNRVTDAERAAESREPILRELRQSNEETVSRAREAMADNPSLVAEITARAPDAPISVTEEAALLIGKVEARNRREEAAAVIADPKATPERKAAAQRAWDDAEAEINRIDEANVARGREWGRLGQFRQRLMAADYTLEAMESKLRRAKGEELTQAETAGLRDLADRLKTAETDLETARAKIAEYEQTVIVRETIEQAVRVATAQMRGAKKAVKSAVEYWEARADAAMKRIKSAESVPSKRGQSGAVTNPVALLADVLDIGVYQVVKGASSLGDWIKAMKSALGDRFEVLRDQWPDLFAASRRAAVAAKPDAPTTAEVLATIDPANVTREDVRDLVMARIRAGEREADAIMKAVTADVQTVAPSLTEADVRQLFADYGKRASPTRDADKQTLRDLRTVVRLEKDIADAEAGVARKTPAARQRASEEIRQLRARLSELLKQATRRARTPEAEAVLLAKRREVLEKQIADLEDMIATGRRPAKRERPDERQPELAARRDELQREIRRIDAAMRPRRSPDEVYQQRRGTSIAREIERVQARIAAGDYARSPRVPKALNEANKAAALKLEELRAEFKLKQFDYEMKNSGWMKRVGGYAAQALHLQRAIQTSWDLSGIGRQGVFFLFGHPIRTAKAIPEMLRAAGSRQERLASEEDIKSLKNAHLHKKYGLPINDSTLNRTEEVFTSRLLEKLRLKYKPGETGKNAARLVVNAPLEITRASERGYATVLNRLRTKAFDAFYDFMSEGGRTVTDRQGQLISDFVAATTGRSNVPAKVEGLANGLNLIYFAPRLVWSRFQVLYGHHIWLAALNGEWRAARFMAQEYGRVAGAMALFYALAQAWYVGSGMEEEDEKKGDRRPFIDYDPRSSSFGQLRFGDHYVNPTGGLSQAATFMARMMTGETVTGSGETVRLSDDPSRSLSNKLASLAPVFRKYGLDDLADAMPEQNTEKRSPMADDFGDVLARFNRTKLSPVAGAGWDWITGEDYMGQPTTTADILANMMLPMTIGTPWDAYKSETPAGKATALTLFEIIGWGVTHRDRAALDAPDQATMSPDQRKAYNEYLRVSGNMKQDIQAVRDLANSFPADTSASDVRDAVQMKAQELGLDGIDVAQYARKTPARDERGIRKTGLIRTETGRVKMEYAKGSRTKLMMDTEEKVNKLNNEMREFLLHDLTDEQINAKYREYVSGGDAEGNKELVIRQMRDQRDALIKDLMSYED